MNVKQTAGRRILTATITAGILDICAAAILALAHGGTPAGMLRHVASGPFPNAKYWGATGALLGLLTHFAIVAVIVTLFVFAAGRLPWLNHSPMTAGVAYGVAAWAVMNLIVLPLRWPGSFPHDPLAIVIQLFCHVVLVGIPIALIARR